MRAGPVSREKSRTAAPAAPRRRRNGAPSQFAGIPIVTPRDNPEQARHWRPAQCCTAVSVLAGQVDIAPIGGKFLRSPAPGQQVRDAGRTVAAPRGGHSFRPRALRDLDPDWAGGWIREGPGHPVDNGARSRCRRDAFRSEGIPRPSSQLGMAFPANRRRRARSPGRVVRSEVATGTAVARAPGGEGGEAGSRAGRARRRRDPDLQRG